MNLDTISISVQNLASQATRLVWVCENWLLRKQFLKDNTDESQALGTWCGPGNIVLEKSIKCVVCFLNKHQT